MEQFLGFAEDRDVQYLGLYLGVHDGKVNVAFRGIWLVLYIHCKCKLFIQW